MIVKQNVNPLSQTIKAGDTPLHRACIGGDIDIIRYLVNAISQLLPLKDVVDCRGKDGQAPLHMAALNGHLEISSSTS